MVSLQSMPAASSVSMAVEAWVAVSQFIRRVYCGLENTYIRIANAKITMAAMAIMIVFCLDVNLFHHSSTLARISFSLSNMSFSSVTALYFQKCAMHCGVNHIVIYSQSVPFYKKSLNLHLHNLVICFQKFIAKNDGVLQRIGRFLHGH